MPPLEKPSARSSTLPSKDKASQDQGTTEKPRQTDPKRPLTKSSIPPKRPLTTPRAPSFADRSRSSPSTVKPTTARPLSTRTPGTPVVAERPKSRISPAAKTSSLPRTGSRATASRPGSRDFSVKTSIASPTPTDSSHVPDSFDEEGEIKVNLTRALEQKDGEIAGLREDLEGLKNLQEVERKETADKSNDHVVKLELELDETQTRLRELEAQFGMLSKEHNELLELTTTQLDDLQVSNESLHQSLRVVNQEKEKELKDADRYHAQQLKDAASKLEKDFRESAKRTEQDLLEKVSSLSAEVEGSNGRLHEMEVTAVQKQKQINDLSKSLKQSEEALSSVVSKDDLSRLEKEYTAERTALMSELEEAQNSLRLERDKSSDREKDVEELLALQKQEIKNAVASSRAEQEALITKQEAELQKFQAKEEERMEQLEQTSSELEELSSKHRAELDEKTSVIQTLLKKAESSEDEHSQSLLKATEAAQEELQQAREHIKRLEEASLDHEQHFRHVVQKNRHDMEQQAKQHSLELEEARHAHKEQVEAARNSKNELQELLDKQEDLQSQMRQDKVQADERFALKLNHARQSAQEQAELLEKTKEALDDLRRNHDTLNSQMSKNKDEQTLQHNLELGEARDALQKHIELAEKGKTELETLAKQHQNFQEQAKSDQQKLIDQHVLELKGLQSAKQDSVEFMERNKLEFEKLAKDYKDLQDQFKKSEEQHINELKEAQRLQQEQADALVQSRQALEKHATQHAELVAENDRMQQDHTVAVDQSKIKSAEQAARHAIEIEKMREIQQEYADAASKNKEALEQLQKEHTSKVEDFQGSQQKLQDATNQRDMQLKELTKRHSVEIEEAQRAQGDLTNAAERCKKELDQVTEAYELSQKQIQKEKEAFDIQRTEHEELKSEFTAVKLNLASLDEKIKADAEIAATKFAEMKSRHTSEIESSVSQNRRLLAELASFKAALNSGQDQKALKAQLQQQLNELNETKFVLSEQARELSRLREGLEISDRARMVAEQAIQEYKIETTNADISWKNTLTALQREYENAMQNVSSLQSSLKASDENSSRQLTEAAVASKQEVDKLINEKLAAEEQILKLQSHTRALDHECKENARNAANKTVLLQESNRKYSQALEEAAKSKAIIQRKEQEHSKQYQALTTRFEAELVQIHQNHRRELAQVSILQNAVGELQQARDLAIAESNALNRRQSEQLANTVSENSVLKQRLRHLDNAHTEAVTNAQSLTQQLQETKHAHTAQLHNLTQQLEAAKADHTDQSRHLQRQFEETLLEHGTQNQDLARQLEEVKAAHQRLETHVPIEAPPGSKPALHGDHNEIRRHIIALGRQYSIDKADIDALREDMDREREFREQRWRSGAEGRKKLAAEFEKARSGWTAASRERAGKVGEAH